MPAETNRFPIKTGFDMGPDGEVNEDVRDKNRFLTARAGDHLMHDFQCDLCHYRNIKAMSPNPDGNQKDQLLLECIRRCNLDQLWSKEPTTVERNRRELVKAIKLADRMGVESDSLFEVKGARELKDNCAMGLAAVMILRSLDPGRNEQHVQFNTVRAMRAAFGNYWKATAATQEISVLMRGQTKLTSSTSPTNSIWFEGFMLGFHKRVGDVNRPDKAISIELMVAMMEEFEKQWKRAKGSRADEKAVLFPALFSIVAYTASLRGEEVPLMDLGETRTKTLLGMCHSTYPHVVYSLIGRFKNEVGALKHHIPVVEVTSSGLKIRVWLERMLMWYGPHVSGYVFRDGKDNRVSCGHYAQKILSVIQSVQQNYPGIVEADCDVFEEFGMSRSFRRGSDSRALAAGVSQSTIDLINRWRTSDRVQGRTAHLKMSQHYADVRLLLGLFLPYSNAL